VRRADNVTIKTPSWGHHMEWLWTWEGISFGYREDDDLWTHDGRHVGKFQGDEAFGPDGRYLGEILNEDRLITNVSKRGWRSSAFAPYASRVGYVPYANYVGYVMYAGHEDFPNPGDL
jgi:hypothetical protein